MPVFCHKETIAATWRSWERKRSLKRGVSTFRLFPARVFPWSAPYGRYPVPVCQGVAGASPAPQPHPPGTQPSNGLTTLSTLDAHASTTEPAPPGSQGRRWRLRLRLSPLDADLKGWKGQRMACSPWLRPGPNAGDSGRVPGPVCRDGRPLDGPPWPGTPSWRTNR